MSDFGSNIKFEYMNFTNESKSGGLYISHHFRMVFIKNGEAQWHIGNKTVYVLPGDIILFNNDEPRRIEFIKTHELELLVLEFEPRFLFGSDFLHLFLERPDGFTGHIRTEQTGCSVLFDKISQEWEDKQNFYETAISHVCFLILTSIAREIKLVKKKITIRADMKEILEYIDAHLDETITLSDLSRRAHMADGSFSRYFSKCNGIGLSRYIQSKRITQAIYLLKNTDKTILDIALSCGFKNSASFYKAFKALTGKTPTFYRV